MLSKVLSLYKKCGQTPLKCINEFKNNDSGLSNLPMTYAGRLDPLAEGVLLVLIGDECHKKEEYLKLPKEYELTILFGFSTDTYDLMGKVVGPDHENWHGNFASKIQEILPKFTGKIKQKYPPYSSRTVGGKPLFVWAREGRLDEIEIPTHEVEVKSIDIIKEGEITSEQLLEKIKNDISKVGGDFRQEDIINIWEKMLGNFPKENFPTRTLRISCGSGFYARVLAYEIGQAMGIQSLALDIVRTKVGEYTIRK